MNDPHDQHPDFRAMLRREVIDTLRRERLFDSSHLRGNRWRRAGLLGAGGLATLVVGLVWGANTGFASAEVIDARRREEIASNVAATRQFAAMRLELARARYDELRRALANHAASRAALDSAGRDVKEMEAIVARIEHDVLIPAAKSPTPLLGRLPMKYAIAALTCSDEHLVSPVVEAQEPAIVDLPAPSARASDSLRSLSGVRQVSSGDLLVHDVIARQLRRFDSTLTRSTVTLDVTVARPRVAPLPLVAFLGDSSLLADPVSRTFRVLDPAGHVARTVPVPDSTMNLGGSSYADPQGRVIYASRPLWLRRDADSVALLRADLKSGRVDTVARLKDEPFKATKISGASMNGSSWERDEWTALPDGSIMILRASDRHFEIIRPNGSRTTAPALTTEEALAVGDSLTRVVGRQYDLGVRLLGKRDSIGGYEFAVRRLVNLLTNESDRMLSDRDGNVWIEPDGASSYVARVYDVVNGQGQLVRRIRVPAGKSIVGFGRGGVVYTVSGDSHTGFILERVSVKPR